MTDGDLSGCQSGRREVGNTSILRVAVFGLALLITALAGCAGGRLFSPRPLIGRDRLVFRVADNTLGATFYTRNVWYDGDNYRFRDVYGRDMQVAKSDSVTVDIISEFDYYKTP